MERLVFTGGSALGTPPLPCLGSRPDEWFCWCPKIWCHLPQASFCTFCTVLFQNKWKTAFVQHMFSSYSKLFLQLEGLRHYSPSKPYTNKEGLPQKRASAEECKVYLCSLTQDPNFIKSYKISIDSVSPYHWILIATWPKVNYTFKINKEKDIMQSTSKSEPLLSYFCCTPEHTGFSVYVLCYNQGNSGLEGSKPAYAETRGTKLKI